MCLERRGDPLMHRAQPCDRGEEAERTALGCDHQCRKRRRDLADIVARDIGDDHDAGLRGVVERRGDARCRRAFRQVAQPGRGLGGAPGEFRVGFAVGQRRRSHHDAVRRLRHGLAERNTRIDPVAVDRDIGLGAVDAVERQPFDGFQARWLTEIAQ